MRRKCFTLIELLVVVGVIAILLALLLPSLYMAKERAQMTFCMGNMKQYYLLSQSFTADMEGIMPAWYYTHHPDGPTAADNLNNTRWTRYSLTPAMLMDFGYISRDRYFGYNKNHPWVKDGFVEASEKGKSGIFSCPSGWFPTYNAANYVVTSQPLNKLKTLMHPVTTKRIKNVNEKCPDCGNDNYSDAVTDKYVIYTGYFVNTSAGAKSQLWNQGGFYKKRRWKSTPSQVGYLVESNYPLVDPLHTTELYTINKGLWPLNTGVHYAPTTRHMKLTKANFIYADGHIGTLDHIMDGKEWPFLWQ